VGFTTGATLANFTGVASGRDAVLGQTLQIGREHFTIIGDRNTHYGLFDCAPKCKTDSGKGEASSAEAGACC